MTFFQRPLIVVMTGIDGSGKTTHAKLLNSYFQKEGVRSCYKQQMSSGIFMRRFVHRFGERLQYLERRTSSEEFMLNEKSDRVKSSRMLLSALAALRILLTGIVRTWTRVAVSYRCEVIVFDRYFFDVLIKIIWLYDVDIGILYVFNRFVPTPDVVFHLDVDAKVALDRETDGDVTYEQLTAKKQIYDHYMSDDWADKNNIYVVISKSNLDAVQKCIRGKINIL